MKIARPASRFLLLGLIGLSTALPASSQPETDISGTWQVSIPEFKRTPKIELVQQGSKLRGTLRGPAGEFPLVGTVEKSKVRLSVDLRSGVGRFPRKVNPDQATAEFDGTIKGKTMQGTASFPDIEPGRKTEWTATALGNK